MYGLKWFVKQNVPVLAKNDQSAWRLRNDSWLAGLYEKTLLGMLVEEIAGIDLSLRDKFIVFHRIPAWLGVEYAVEIFGEGARLGLLIHTTNGDTRLIPSGALASILIDMGGRHIEISDLGDKYIKNKKIEIHNKICSNKDEYILLKTGNYRGVGRVVDSDRCVVKVKDLAPSGFRILQKPSLEDLIKVNNEIIEEAVLEARRFIKQIYEKYVSPGEIYVSFSGGADSTAVLALAVEELGSSRVIAVSSDTGLEYPENAKYIESIASKLGVNLVVLKPRTSFVDEIERRGLMSVDNRWCTELFKLTPLREFYASKGVKIYLDGARDYESTLRARTPRLAENPALRGVYRVLPIKKWPRILVQLYLLSRKIEINPLYDHGFVRLGCVVCPAMHRYELKLSYDRYPWIHEEILRRSGLSLEEYLSMKWTGRRVFKNSEEASGNRGRD